MNNCADPILCYTTSKSRLFRHYSLASPIFRLQAQQVFDCGKCIFCRKKKSYELAVRCVLHASLYPKNCFLTLTYDETKTAYHNNFDYADIQKFKKRLRRKYEPAKIQIFNVHEYGKNKKKHWHLVVFNHDFADKELHTISGGNRLYKSNELSKLWPSGFSTIGDITEASAMYTAQYTQKDFKNGNTNNSFKSHSKHSGIGRDYFYRHYANILALGYISVSGRKIPVPRYFLKLAHRHYCHFYEPSAFESTVDRLPLYRRLPPGSAKRDLADLFIAYKENKKEFLEEKIKNWNDFIQSEAFSTDVPDFALSAENFLYDLQQRNSKDI